LLDKRVGIELNPAPRVNGALYNGAAIKPHTFKKVRGKIRGFIQHLPERCRIYGVRGKKVR
jgi:hypothetical protein